MVTAIPRMFIVFNRISKSFGAIIIYFNPFRENKYYEVFNIFGNNLYLCKCNGDLEIVGQDGVYG